MTQPSKREHRAAMRLEELKAHLRHEFSAEQQVKHFWCILCLGFVADGGASLMNPEVPPKIQIG
jgi:hypothetical protein